MNKFMNFVLMVFFLARVQSWTNYNINFLTAKVLSTNADYVKWNNFNVLKTNRTYSYLNINFTVVKPMDDVAIHGQFYQYVSNRFKESFPAVGTDFCSFITMEKRGESGGFSDVIFQKLKKPVRENLYSPGSHFPKSCPIKADTYHAKIHVDEDKLPSFFLPAGRWKLQLELSRNNTLDFFKISFTFEVVDFVSENQKKRG